MYLCLYRVAKPIIPGYKISLMIRFQLSACLGHKTCQYNHSDIPSRCPKNGKWMATGIFGALPSFGLYVHHSASGSPRPSIKYICLWHQTLKWVLDTFFDSSALANCFFFTMLTDETTIVVVDQWHLWIYGKPNYDAKYFSTLEFLLMFYSTILVIFLALKQILRVLLL